MSDTCPRTVYPPDGWSPSHACGKPVKGIARDGVAVCGIHLRADKRRAEGEEKYDAQRERHHAMVENVERADAALDSIFAAKVPDDTVQTYGWGEDRVLVRWDVLAHLLGIDP
jgi:hypothetical protein